LRRYLSNCTGFLLRWIKSLRRGIVLLWPHLSIVFVFLGGLVSGVLVHQLEKYYDDRDRATIKVTSNNPIIREFGVVQVSQAGSRIRQRRLRDERRGSTLTINVPAGEYEICLRVLDKILLNEERGLDKGTTLQYSDADLPPPLPEFFPDQDFVEIPGGVFTQGSAGFAQSSPPHEISLSTFRIRSIPVTACEYSSYYLSTGRYFQVGYQADDVTVCSGKDEHSKPAAWLTWDDANSFCRWLSNFKGQSFRLPTEAEYERAMRIAHPKSKYPWGDSEYDPEMPRVLLANYVEFWRGRATPDRTPVRGFPAVNGLFDIAGDVWEWTSDWYDPRFYSTKEAKLANSHGPTMSPLHHRVVRGGSCQDPIEDLSCAWRGHVDPNDERHNVGFRVVKE